MKPERELAQIFGISRRKVREAVDALVEAQILVREHGSGVYVRKIPPAPVGEVEAAFGFDEIFLRDREGDDRQRLQISSSKRSLKLEVWWRSVFQNQTALLFRQGLADEAEALGHSLQFRDLPSGAEAERVASQMLGEMGRLPQDGYIIHVPFVDACDLIDTLVPAPVIYVSAGLQALRHQPMIRFDGTEMNQRAIELLAEQGFQRIALLAFRPDHRELNETPQKQGYEAVLRRLRLRYRSYQEVPLNEAAIRSALEPLLRGPDACDALYLSDDYLLEMALPILHEYGVRPGENLGMIVVANRGSALPSGYDWSRIEYDPYNSGRLTISSLIRSIESAGGELLSFSHHPAWRPGQTHLSPPAPIHS